MGKEEGCDSCGPVNTDKGLCPSSLFGVRVILYPSPKSDKSYQILMKKIIKLHTSTLLQDI